ncbi:DUF2141 domain-containing protein [Paracoccus sp. 1_MG-2023]|uniref:DUF2141 domain-containing protein n=1 Tax=unclassified Paracoccus (in: a-proteobacteria) TaxID=2688777 RepID=UPI001C0A2D85|nr:MULTISPECIES: DUF2141 domain-containing protein [unclassified Paracoccus (in: a-proteobacteria)]MBU2958278.1 DUF2141 domain-containing protein [Paracoccus sp. C2R09]MDO6668405.1 DUF2141 domain-containing protein [Paracoccus sp. 1_MG-2023]
MLRCLCVLATILPATGHAGRIDIAFTDLPSAEGSVFCALHDHSQGFPGSGQIASQRVAAGQGHCRFDGLPPGRYAVAILHDRNDNGRMDVNALGLPVEAWGVSGNIRPMMRAPRFDEAAFQLDDRPRSMSIRMIR